MGRDSTGAYTTGESLSINLSFLLKKGFLKRGVTRVGELNWTRNGEPCGSIHVVSSWHSGPAPSLTLVYTTTDRTTGEKEDREDPIDMVAVPSNLGKGEVLYFLCPQTGRRCRILYKAYGSRIWKSREAYSNRLYYSCQQVSKRDYFNDRYWTLEKQLEKLYTKRTVRTYRGRVTRRAKRLQRLEQSQAEFDALRWSPAAMPLGLRRSIFNDDGTVKPFH